MNLALKSKSVSVGIVLATLALSALFVARGVNDCIASALPRAAYAKNRAATRAGSPPGTEPPDLCAILARNAFDPETGVLCPAKPVAVTAPPPAPPSSDGPPPCEGETRKLVAAVHSERDPAASFAEVISAQSVSQLLREGDRIDDSVLFAIYPTAVHLKQPSGHYCSLTMFGAPAPNPAPPSLAPANDVDSSIKAGSGNNFTVQRAFVDKVLKDPASGLGSVRVVPHSEGGLMVGMKLYGIRRDSPLHALGLQNGDALLAINGLPITSTDAALEAYGQLRAASNLSVSLQRRGQPMTVAYSIE